jgi:EmrB/QacA subfamily drug resistance transporter
MTDRKRTLIFINIIITCIATSMLATALTTALPPILADLNISAATGQWLTSGYSLAMGIIMPLTAFMIRRFKTKRLYLCGIAIFIAGLLVCALAPSFEVMMAGRVLQACGNGILVSMAQVVILTIFPPEKKGTVMGWYGLAIGTAPVIAPTIAGAVVDAMGWRMIFYAAMAIALVSFVMACFVFDNVLESAAKRFDASSFVLSIFAFGGVTLGVGNITSYGIFNKAVYIPLGIGIITSVAFVVRQLRLENPFLNVGILRISKYALSVIGSMLLYLVMMGSSVITPLYVQSIMHRPAMISGLVTLPGSLAMAIVSPFAGKIYDKLGMKKLYVAGAAFMLISNVGMYLISVETPLIVVVVLNAIRCIAIGCLMMPLVTWGTSYVDKHLVADATALLSSLRTIAGSIGSAVFVGIMTMIADPSSDKFTDTAKMHGLNVSFLIMSVVTLLLLLIAVFCVKEDKK